MYEHNNAYERICNALKLAKIHRDVRQKIVPVF